MTGLIISNGNINNYDKLIKAYNLSDYVVCADGGIRHLRAIDKTPDIVLGDLDSVSIKDIEYIKSKNIKMEKFPPIKDNTDTDLAANYLIGLGFKKIFFLGATGDRIDHTLANIFLLNSLLEKGIDGIIIDDKNEIHLVDSILEIEDEENTYISIIPICQEGIKISISGCFYNLNNVSIPFASTRGISNEIVDSRAKIEIHRGKAIIIKAID